MVQKRASERYNLAPSSLPQRNKAEKALKEQAPAWEFWFIQAEQAIPQFLSNSDFYCLRKCKAFKSLLGCLASLSAALALGFFVVFNSLALHYLQL